MSTLYKVYVKTDSNNNIITAPNSSVFLTDLTGWTQIDEGEGEKYALASGHYFDLPIEPYKGVYRYTLDASKSIGEMVTAKTATEIAAEETALQTANLPALQAAKQSENNAALAAFLSDNPLTYTDGKQYGVTLSDQQELSLNLLQYQLAVSAGTAPTLEWHAVHEACTEWTYADLSALSLAIATYVYPYIRQNQALKTQIYATSTAAELDAITINYEVTESA